MLGIASEGDVFVHGARPADGSPLTFEDTGYVVPLEDASSWARGVAVARPTITQSQQETGWQVRTVILPCKLILGGDSGSSDRMINVVLADGTAYIPVIALYQMLGLHAATHIARWRRLMIWSNARKLPLRTVRGRRIVWLLACANIL